MLHDQDKNRIKKELDSVNSRIEEINLLFANDYNLRSAFHTSSHSSDRTRDYYSMLLSKYGHYSNYNDSVYVLELKLCEFRKTQLEYELRMDGKSNNIVKALDYIDGITPKHVSGRVYKVNDGDGCGVFLLWFLIIDAIIILIIFLMD